MGVALHIIRLDSIDNWIGMVAGNVGRIQLDNLRIQAVIVGKWP